MLDAAVALYRARFGRLVRITLAVIVPVQILNTLVLLSAEPDSFRPNLTGGVSANYDSGSASMHLAATLLVLVLTVISTAFVAVVSVYGPLPSSSSPAAKMLPLSVTAAADWSVAFAVVETCATSKPFVSR